MSRADVTFTSAVAAWLASTTSEMGATAVGEIGGTARAVGWRAILTSTSGSASAVFARLNIVATVGYAAYKLGGYLDRKLCLSDWISDYWRAMLDPKPEGARIYSSPEEFKKTQTLWYNLFGGR
jgi:hypothetical protein